MPEEQKEIEWIPVDQLHFDPDNPRLPSTIDKTDEAKVFSWMLTDAMLTELMTSIGAAGYFPAEPLIAHKVGENYEVIEGNRRLAAVRLLRNPELATSRKKAVAIVAENATEKPEYLPVIVYPDRSAVLAYLGYRHVTGIKEWNPLAKAKYLKDLYQLHIDKEGEGVYSTLAKLIGSRADYAARLLTSLSVYEHIANNDFYDISGVSEDSIGFSVLTTALNYSNIKEFVGIEKYSFEGHSLSDSNLKDLTAWLFEKNTEGKTRLGESRNLKDLNKVVGSEKALESFKEGYTLADAALYTDAADEAFHAFLLEAKKKLKEARDQQHLMKIKKVKDKEILEEILSMTKNMIGSWKASFEEEE